MKGIIRQAITSSRRKSPIDYANALYTPKLYNYIVDNQYDTVVMPRLFPVEVLIGLMPIHTEPIFALCIIYLFFSLVVRIRPHTRRTRITYILLALSSLYMVYAHWIPRQVCGGMLLISCIVVHKNSLRQQISEEQRAVFLYLPEKYTD